PAVFANWGTSQRAVSAGTVIEIGPAGLPVMCVAVPARTAEALFEALPDWHCCATTFVTWKESVVPAPTVQVMPVESEPVQPPGVAPTRLTPASVIVTSRLIAFAPVFETDTVHVAVSVAVS